MTDTSMRVNSYRDEARNRTLYQLVAEVGGMRHSVEFDSNADHADLAIVLRLLANELDDIAAVGVQPPDPWTAARAHWIAQAEGGGCISPGPRGVLNSKNYFMSNIEELRQLNAQQQLASLRMSTITPEDVLRDRQSWRAGQQQYSDAGTAVSASIGIAKNQLLTHKEMSLRHQTWLDSLHGLHGLRSGDKAA